MQSISVDHPGSPWITVDIMNACPGPGTKLSSPHNAELVQPLLELRHRFGDTITPQERAILTMSVDLMDYMWDHATERRNEEY
jgi:hypothetical protein